MTRFTVSLEFIDEENDIITKVIEFHILTQNLVNRISSLFAKYQRMREVAQFITDVPTMRAKIVENEIGKIDKLNKLRLDLKEARKQFAELSSEEIQQDKYKLLVDIMVKNRIDDKRFLNPVFWEENVDASEIYAFLTSVLLRGKKKEILSQKKEDQKSSE